MNNYKTSLFTETGGSMCWRWIRTNTGTYLALTVSTLGWLEQKPMEADIHLAATVSFTRNATAGNFARPTDSWTAGVTAVPALDH